MGRRALRPIDPSLDLSHHLRPLADLCEQAGQLQLFERDASLQVEVGCGKGLFLQRAASGQPDQNFVGIEMAGKYARYAAARLAKSGLPNAIVIHGDANQLFADRLQPESLAAVHVYFPDPWWKERHIRRRIMNPVFLQLVERTLQPQGQLHFWTDVEEYYRLSLSVIDEATQLSGPFDIPQRDAQHDMDYHTHFERRTRLHQQPVFRARFEK